MIINKPYHSPLTGWVVKITKEKGPMAVVVEEIKCDNREQAWETYRRLLKGL